MNPGNSGGPMLSTSGEILGINTYRIEESSDGRDAEALGFAVSIETIQSRLGDLKGDVSSTPTPKPFPTPRTPTPTLQPVWTPTPTPTPRPTWTPTPIATPTPGCGTFEECMEWLDRTLTPSPVVTSTVTRTPVPTPSPNQTSGDFGPWDVELVHDEADGFIEQYVAGVHLTDVEVSATFHNPYNAYSGRWDYGILVRYASHIDDSLPFLSFVVKSDREWKITRRDFYLNELTVLGEGYLSNWVDDPARFITGANGSNHLRVVIKGNKTEFFVNGNLVSTVGVPGVLHAGDVSVATGIAEYERDGAITRVTDWRVISLEGNA